MKISISIYLLLPCIVHMVATSLGSLLPHSRVSSFIFGREETKGWLQSVNKIPLIIASNPKNPKKKVKNLQKNLPKNLPKKNPNRPTTSPLNLPLFHSPSTTSWSAIRCFVIGITSSAAHRDSRITFAESTDPGAIRAVKKVAKGDGKETLRVFAFSNNRSSAIWLAKVRWQKSGGKSQVAKVKKSDGRSQKSEMVVKLSLCWIFTFQITLEPPPYSPFILLQLKKTTDQIWGGGGIIRFHTCNCAHLTLKCLSPSPSLRRFLPPLPDSIHFFVQFPYNLFPPLPSSSLFSNSSRIVLTPPPIFALPFFPEGGVWGDLFDSGQILLLSNVACISFGARDWWKEAAKRNASEDLWPKTMKSSDWSRRKFWAA